MQVLPANLALAGESAALIWAVRLATAWLVIVPLAHVIALRYLLLAGALGALLWHERGIVWRTLPLLPIFALWLAAALLSLIHAPDPLDSLREIKSEILMGLAVLYLFFRLGTRRENILGLLNGLLAGIAVGFVLQLGTHFGWWPPALARHYPGASIWSAILALILPLLVYRYFAVSPVYRADPARSGRVPGQPWIVALFLLVLISGYFTFNRAVWVAMAATALVFALALPWDAAWRRRAAPLAVVIALAVGCFWLIHYTRLQAIGNVPVTVDFARDVRPQLWAFSVELIQNGPLFGAGFGQIIQAPAINRVFDPPLWHAHNLFLDAGLQMGWPGIAIMLLLFIATARHFTQLASRARVRGDASARLAAVAGLACVTALLVKNTPDNAFVDQTAFIYWALIGCFAGQAARVRV